MNCRQIDALLDQPLLPTDWPRDAMEHLNSCPRCRALIAVISTQPAELPLSDIDDSIRLHLLDNLTPVQPLASLTNRTTMFALAATVIAALLAAATGWKGWHVMTAMHRAITYPLAATLLTFQALVVANEMEPGRSRPHIVWALAVVIPFVLLLIPLVLLTPALDEESLSHGTKCFGRGIFTSVVIIAGLVGWLRRGYYVNRSRAGVAIGLLAGLGAFISQELYCPIIEEAWHVGLAHIGVVVTAALIGFLAGRFSPREI